MMQEPPGMTRTQLPWLHKSMRHTNFLFYVQQTFAGQFVFRVGGGWGVGTVCFNMKHEVFLQLRVGTKNKGEDSL